VKTTIINTVKVIAVVYIIICVLLYFFQEKLIFFPEKLTKDHTFQFNQKFEELNFKTADDKLLNGILFKSDSSKGLIFYLHGNAGSIKSWGEIAQTYTSLNYDLFMLDYRGYGKSEGAISSEKQFYSDVQLTYDILKKKYAENKIIISGYSIGTGAATKLASTNNAKFLILQAPYYSLTDMMQHSYAIIPTFILKYKFKTNTFIQQCKMPVVIFHGNSDQVIYYNSSIKLKALFKETDTLITLENQGHNNMSENLLYQTELQKILNR
jgi:uncharacterized protein